MLFCPTRAWCVSAGLNQIEYCLQGWLMLISHRKVKQETVVISLGLYLWSPYGLAIPFGLGINSTIRSDEEIRYASFMLISRYSIHILSWSSQRCVHKGAYSLVKEVSIKINRYIRWTYCWIKSYYSFKMAPILHERWCSNRISFLLPTYLVWAAIGTDIVLF